MADIRIVSIASLEGVWADWLLRPDGTLDDTEDLVTAVRLALLTDRLAAPRDDLPDIDSDDRRGWWGDHEAESIWGGWPIGCKNWLLARAKIVGPEARQGSTLVRAETYTHDALRPLVEQRICSHIAVSAERVGRERIDVTVKLYRGPLKEIELRFQDLWRGVNV